MKYSDKILQGRKPEVATVQLFSNYEKSRAEWKKFQAKNITGRGVKVAVIDTGCNTTYVPCDYYTNYTTDPDADSVGHGTITTSIIKHPEIGLANGCEIHHIKAIDDSSVMSEADFLEAMAYCITNTIDIVNMSWGTSFSSMQSTINDVWDAGCILVGASGNSFTSANIATPAGMTNVIAVNAIQDDGTVIYQSHLVAGNATHGIDVACSGWGNEGINPSTGAIGGAFGTSYAAPFFCGMFACVKEELGITDNKMVLQYMLNKCVKQYDTTNFGRGILTA